MSLEEKNQPEEENLMTTLSGCMKKVIEDGYADNFTIEATQLFSPSTGRKYTPLQVQIDNFYRFEGLSDPGDSSVLYAITTEDGVKGMIIDVYGPGANEEITMFIKKVEDMKKAEAE